MKYMNNHLEKLPKHLKTIMVDQHYENYTSIDHAVWRYVMRKNVNYLKKVAHQSYILGLEKTGISLDKIPSIEEMNQRLSKIGWAACTVDGFIHPQAFMEFQAYNVLVIAADIRQLKHIEYTPAPDIIHEAAGHAPIIGDPEYAEYLRYFGEIGCRAFSSAKDYEIFESIRHLSIIKEDPYTPQEEIEKAERELEILTANAGEPSEMSLIRRLHWWTVEYGLIGEIENPKIYGAGLLSSIGESAHCMTPEVKKIFYDINAINYDFDITKPQPQLFVTPDFAHLKSVLEEFAARMALKKGGAYALEKAKESANTATVELSSGLQMTGILAEYETDRNGNPSYIRFSSPTALCCQNKQLKGHGKDFHLHGFSSPIGAWKIAACPELLSDGDLENIGIIIGKDCKFETSAGFVIEAFLENILRNDEGKLISLKFSNCTITKEGKTYYQPEWGNFDMAVGTSVISAYSGAADPDAYQLEFQVPAEKTHKINYDDKMRYLHTLYAEVRDIRDNGKNLERLSEIFNEIANHYSDQWLIVLEILEVALSANLNKGQIQSYRSYLEDLKLRKLDLKNLIDDGLELLDLQFQN